MAHKEYPKMLYLDGKKGIIVENAEEEAKLVKKDIKEEKPTDDKAKETKPAGWGK